MISEVLNEKFLRHKKHMESKGEENLGDLFDKFKALCGIYNMLYSQLPARLREGGIEIKGNPGDQERATKCVQQYLSTEVIMSTFRERNGTEMESLLQVIKLKIFNIKLDNEGEPKVQKGSTEKMDDLILQRLESGNDEETCAELLLIVYAIRCNTIHGSKDMEDIQRLLLIPVMNLMAAVTDLMYQKMIE